MSIDVRHEVPISYSVYNVFSRYWWGQADPLYAALLRRGDSVSIVSVEVSDEEFERLVDTADEILLSSEEPTELATAKSFKRALLRRGRRDTHAVRNPGHPATVRNAAADFATFHNFDPKRVDYAPRVTVPSQIPVVGSCEWVLYRSNKWGEGTHDYIHEITSHPRVMVGIVGDRGGKMTKVPKRIQQTKSVSLIGKCLGWQFTDKDGESMETKVTRCQWWWSKPGRALLAVEDKRRIVAIVWGGKLNVEARGIVG